MIANSFISYQDRHLQLTDSLVIIVAGLCCYIDDGSAYKDGGLMRRIKKAWFDEGGGECVFWSVGIIELYLDILLGEGDADELVRILVAAKKYLLKRFGGDDMSAEFLNEISIVGDGYTGTASTGKVIRSLEGFCSVLKGHGEWYRNGDVEFWV